MYRPQEGGIERGRVKGENGEAVPSAHKSLSLPTSAPVSLIHKGYDGWPGQVWRFGRGRKRGRAGD